MNGSRSGCHGGWVGRNGRGGVSFCFCCRNCRCGCRGGGRVVCLCLGVGLVSATKSVHVSVHLQASCSETNTHVGTAPESPVHVDPARWPAKGTVTRIRSSCDAGLKQGRNTHPTGPHPMRTLAAQLPSLDRGACWQHISRCIARARQRSCVCGGTGRSSLSLLLHGTVHLIASSRPRNPFSSHPPYFPHGTQRNAPPKTPHSNPALSSPSVACHATPWHPMPFHLRF